MSWLLTLLLACGGVETMSFEEPPGPEPIDLGADIAALAAATSPAADPAPDPDDTDAQEQADEAEDEAPKPVFVTVPIEGEDPKWEWPMKAGRDGRTEKVRKERARRNPLDPNEI